MTKPFFYIIIRVFQESKQNKKKEGNPMNSFEKKDATKIVIKSLLLSIFFYFFGPFMMMMGWNIIAWEYGIMQFNYLQMFCICNGLHWFIKGFRK